MNAVLAAVLLAFVATASATSVVTTGSQYYYPSAVQYVAPSTSQYQYQYHVQQPVVSSSSLVHQTVPVTYASSAVVPSTSYLGYPYAYTYPYGSYGYTLIGKK